MKSHVILLAFFLTLLAVVPFSMAALRNGETDRCDAAFARSDFDAAITCLSEELAREPNSVSALRRRSAAFYAKGDLDRALTDSNEIICQRPEALFGYMLRGELYFRKNDYDRAIADYTEALRIKAEPTFIRKPIRTVL